MSTVSNVGTQVDLKIRQGADFAMTLTFANSDGSPFDLSGYVLTAQMRKLAHDAVPAGIFSFSIPAPSNGVATMQMAAAVSELIECGDTLLDPASQYIWDLELKDAGGKIFSPVFGNVSVFREVTR